MLSDTNIVQNLKKGIDIEPYEERRLSPIGYDFSVGDWAFSLKKKREFDIKAQGRVVVEPGDTVIIETLESMTLSREFGATIHSMVSLLTEGGISHISTTIDPTHSGKLLIQFHNQSFAPVVLAYKRSFCTVCFYHMDSPATMNTPHKTSRITLKEALIKSADARSPEPFYKQARFKIIFAVCSIAVVLGVVILQFLNQIDPTIIYATASILTLVFYIIFNSLRGI